MQALRCILSRLFLSGMRVLELLLDPWQQEIIDYDGNILLGKGRRIGATHTFAKKAVEHLIKNKNNHPSSQIVCVSLTEDQAQLIIAFAHDYAKLNCPKLIAKGKDKPTLNRLILNVDKNRRILLARPVGTTGDSARGFEGQILMVDEASRMPKSFWVAAKPILATTGGKIWMWSTFFGTENYFYDKFKESCIAKNPKSKFKVWLKTTEEVFANREISESWTKEQQEEGLKFLEEEKRDMTTLEYAQEYLASASNDLRQFFKEELIHSCMNIDREVLTPIPSLSDNYLGVDIAGMGSDETVLFSLTQTPRKKIEQIDMEITTKTRTTETITKIKIADKRWDYRQIGVDDGGMGVGVFDNLREDDQTKRKVIAINNASRGLEYNSTHKKRILKEDLYNNLLSLMEQGLISLWKDERIFMSLSSIQVEYINGKLKIHGRYSHITEALIRAAWCIKNKPLNIWIR